MQDIIRAIEEEQMKKDLPDFGPGDTVKVHVKVVEGTRERIQVLRVLLSEEEAGAEPNLHCQAGFLRSSRERTFPLHSPRVSKIEVTRRGKVRRAKLYYLRERVVRRPGLKKEEITVENRLV